MIKPSPFKIAQVMTIRLSHARDSSTVFPLLEKFIIRSVSAEDCDSQKCSIQASAIIDMPFCVRRSVFQFVFHVKVPPFYKSGRRITSPAFAYGFPASRKDAARSMQAAS